MDQPRENDTYLAGRLVQWALRVRARPIQDVEYSSLINRYLDNSQFRDTVRQLADGLGIKILEVGELGVIVGPQPDSVFAMPASAFHPTRGTAEERLLDGLIQVAIAATIFPRARDLNEDATYARPAVTIEEIEQTLRVICDHYEEQAKAQPDPETTEHEKGLKEAWRIYQGRLFVGATKDGRSSRGTTHRLIERNLERLAELGCFVKDNIGSGARYQPTFRYQVQVKELAAAAVFQRIQACLASTAKPPEGSA
jgi:hypothetical protein